MKESDKFTAEFLEAQNPPNHQTEPSALVQENEDNEDEPVSTHRSSSKSGVKADDTAVSDDSLLGAACDDFFVEELPPQLKSEGDDEIQPRIQFVWTDDMQQPALFYSADARWDFPTFENSLVEVLRKFGDNTAEKEKFKQRACQTFKLNLADYSDKALSLDEQDKNLKRDVVAAARALRVPNVQLQPYANADEKGFSDFASDIKRLETKDATPDGSDNLNEKSNETGKTWHTEQKSDNLFSTQERSVLKALGVDSTGNDYEVDSSDKDEPDDGTGE